MTVDDYMPIRGVTQQLRQISCSFLADVEGAGYKVSFGFVQGQGRGFQPHPPPSGARGNPPLGALRPPLEALRPPLGALRPPRGGTQRLYK